MGLKFTYALLPTSIFIIAGLIIWNYPLTRERQQRIRDAIDRRDARRQSSAEAATAAATYTPD
jgi:Na+/melibiose symporter-like transporter